MRDAYMTETTCQPPSLLPAAIPCGEAYLSLRLPSRAASSRRETLGSGNFASVKRAQYKGKEKIESMPENVAIKIIDKAKVEDMNDIQVDMP
eukprot:scaffold20064_cov32-Tisochrysis_lutea.AAC.1